MNKKSQIYSRQPINVRFCNKYIFRTIFILIVTLIISIFPVSVNADSYPIVVLSSKSINFGSVIVGEFSDPSLLTVENDQHATNFLTVTEINIEGKDADDFFIRNDKLSGRLLETSMSSTVEVVFKPKSAGTKSAILVITNNATFDLELTTAEVILSGVGTGEAKTNHVWPNVIYIITGLLLLIVLFYLFKVIKSRKRLN